MPATAKFLRDIERELRSIDIDGDSGCSDDEYGAYDDDDRSYRSPTPDNTEHLEAVQPEEANNVIKILYELRRNRLDSIIWTGRIPERMKRAEEQPMASLILRKTKHENDDGTVNHKLSSIIIRHAQLREALQDVFADCKDISVDLKRVEFNSPFKPFIRRWSRMEAKLSECIDDSPASHIFRKFYNIISCELQGTLKDINNLIAGGVITFEHIWILFETGQMVVCPSDEQAFIFCNGTYEEHSYQLILQYIDFDGTKFGKDTTKFAIHAFDGAVCIGDLPFVPIGCYRDWNSIKERLVKRGRKFAELAGHHYKGYSGNISRGDTVMKAVKDRIIIDTKIYYEVNNRSIDLDPLTGYEDPHKEIRALWLARDDEFALCIPIVWGFSLKTKCWGEYKVDDIYDIQWNEECISRLIIPHNSKELLLSLLEQKVSENNFDDVIEGKGGGLIILLSGDTGVGKTVTAEAIAESMKAPLYPVIIGDLGYHDSRVESSLKSTLELATKLKAVILFDDGDIFLEHRSHSDLQRNELVSVFVRELEYFKGTLVITTKRNTVIDPAIKSRIHISINYPNLDFESRKTLWANFIQQNASNNTISEEELNVLAMKEFNGHDIKNIIRSALSIARRRRVLLAIEHIKIVAEILEA